MYRRRRRRRRRRKEEPWGDPARGADDAVRKGKQNARGCEIRRSRKQKARRRVWRDFD